MEPMQTSTVARQALSLTLGAAQQMILPPLLGEMNLANFDEFEAAHAYLIEEMIRVENRFYWCVGAGISGAVAPVHVDGDALNGAATFRAMHWGRNVVTLVNVSPAGSISLSRGLGAAVDHGIVLYPGGVHNEGYSGPRPYAGAWYAVGDIAGRTLAISEG